MFVASVRCDVDVKCGLVSISYFSESAAEERSSNRIKKIIRFFAVNLARIDWLLGVTPCPAGVAIGLAT